MLQHNFLSFWEWIPSHKKTKRTQQSTYQWLSKISLTGKLDPASGSVHRYRRSDRPGEISGDTAGTHRDPYQVVGIMLRRARIVADPTSSLTLRHSACKLGRSIFVAQHSPHCSSRMNALPLLLAVLQEVHGRSMFASHRTLASFVIVCSDEW
jgi:hypothetical protein